MACFIVPAVEAVAVTVAAKVVKQRETHAEAEVARVDWSRKLHWLSALLWGGVLLLAFEHLWHGEIVPFFPFLTAMNSPGETAEMLHEMGTVGVTMAAIVTLVWFVVCLAADSIVQRKEAAL